MRLTLVKILARLIYSCFQSDRAENLNMQGWSYFKNLVNVSLFLSHCRICGELLADREEKIVCGRCISEVEPARSPSCVRCDRIIPHRQNLCGQCMLRPPPYRQHLSYGLYEGVLREMILLFKYGEILILKRPLIDWLFHLVACKAKVSYDCILPVPLDPGRKRGINHTLELARGLAKRLNIPLARNCLRKVRSTQPQVGLSMKSREQNLNGAFQLRCDHRLKGTRVLLVDDVFTTGTTVAKCAGLLRKAGAETVVLTLAKSRF